MTSTVRLTHPDPHTAVLVVDDVEAAEVRLDHATGEGAIVEARLRPGAPAWLDAAEARELADTLLDSAPEAELKIVRFEIETEADADAGGRAGPAPTYAASDASSSLNPIRRLSVPAEGRVSGVEPSAVRASLEVAPIGEQGLANVVRVLFAPDSGLRRAVGEVAFERIPVSRGPGTPEEVDALTGAGLTCRELRVVRASVYASRSATPAWLDPRMLAQIALFALSEETHACTVQVRGTLLGLGHLTTASSPV